jgi:phosphoribosylanthranilate isomerase
MRAKICGITQLVDAQLAIEQGAWALGFNFYPHSPRFIEPGAAHDIIRQLPKDVLKVGIMIGATASELESMMANVGLDLIQVYEDWDVKSSLKQRMILSLQASSVTEIPPHEILNQYAYVLLDAPKHPDGLLGGSGRVSHWDIAAQLSTQYRLLLAGGLTPQNVRDAIKAVHPYAVDVASGVQRIPGRIDSKLLQDFLRQVNDDE